MSYGSTSSRLDATPVASPASGPRTIMGFAPTCSPAMTATSGTTANGTATASSPIAMSRTSSSSSYTSTTSATSSFSQRENGAHHHYYTSNWPYGSALHPVSPARTGSMPTAYVSDEDLFGSDLDGASFHMSEPPAPPRAAEQWLAAKPLLPPPTTAAQAIQQFKPRRCSIPASKRRSSPAAKRKS